MRIIKNSRQKPATKLTFAIMPKTYEGLVRLHMPRPIHDEIAYDNTCEIADALAGHKLNADQDDYFALLCDLIEAYDKQHGPPDPEVSPLDMLKHLMEEHDLTGDALAGILGTDRSLAYRILSGERNLTTAHIKKLSTHFACSPALFI
jgi:HTH-type transcriptional regulator/antitoxin HigA